MNAQLPTVLHVEDDDNDRLLVKIACRNTKLPIRLTGVPDGEQAIAYLKGDAAYGDRDRYPFPSLILLDLKLPRKSGFEVLEWIRRQDQLRHLPVVIFSSSGLESDEKRAFKNGANSYSVKPIALDPLVEMVKQIHRRWLSESAAVCEEQAESAALVS